MAETVVTRTHRLVGGALGLFFGVNVAVLGFFLELVVVTAVAGVFIGVGTALLVPALVHAAQTGGLPAVSEESVLGTGLNSGALGVGLDVGGLVMVFAGFVVDFPPVPIAVGVVVAGAVYVVVDWVVLQQDAEGTPEDGDGESSDDASNTSAVLGVVAGFLLVQGLSAWAESPAAAATILGLSAVVVGIAARREGYV